MRETYEEIQTAEIGTAGAYVSIDGLFLFALGSKPNNARIPIYRLGGHLATGESGWECAVREVREETGLHIIPTAISLTYFLPDGDNPDQELEPIQWLHEPSKKPDPFLVVAYKRYGGNKLSLMYQVHAIGDPKPCSEVKGLVFLNKEEIHWLCREPVTLDRFLSNGGKAILMHEFDESMVLEPFLQIQLLSRILLQNGD